MTNDQITPEQPQPHLGSLAVGGQEVILTRAAAADVPAIVALLADDVLGQGREHAGTDPRYTEAFEAIDADPNQVLVVARAGGEMAATAQLTFIPGLSRGGALRAQVEAVRVAADYRGAGLGEAFFRWMATYAADRGATLMQLTSDRSRTDAVRFYERLGFVASHVGMKLPLHASGPTASASAESEPHQTRPGP
ncbi:N-acetyltransferase family protein [Pseudactinotalea sp. Z1748]|uniref:GNAT family N-acetyltransferase n=1 Tax=Pseudactinotalea sp. Z1748 TaxID=3413027 RepID=UPI003C7A9CF7